MTITREQFIAATGREPVDGDLERANCPFDEIREAARLEERARCVAIARSLVSNDPDWDASYWNQACERIAMAIEMGAAVEVVRPNR